MKHAIITILVGVLCCATQAFAEGNIRSLSDGEMEDISGKTFCNLKRCTGDIKCGLTFARCTFVQGGGCESDIPPCTGRRNQANTQNCVTDIGHSCNMYEKEDFYTTCVDICKIGMDEVDPTIQVCDCFGGIVGDPVKLKLQICRG